MSVDPRDAAAAAYIDAKADAARRHARNKPQERDLYDHVARVLDALADEIRMGLPHVLP